jgi:hypothetical protein
MLRITVGVRLERLVRFLEITDVHCRCFAFSATI